MRFDYERLTKTAKKKIYFFKIKKQIHGRICHVLIIKPYNVMLLIILLSTIFGVVLGAMVVFYFFVYIEDHTTIPIRRIRRDKGILRGPNRRTTRTWPISE